MRNEEALYKEAEDARKKKRDRESILDDLVSCCRRLEIYVGKWTSFIGRLFLLCPLFLVFFSPTL